MASNVPVNEATQEQIQVLLGLTEDEVQQVIALRPSVSPEAFRRVLPARFANRNQALELQKFDINQATEEEIQRIVGASADVARAIVANRPYYAMLGLRDRTVGDPAMFDRLIAF